MANNLFKQVWDIWGEGGMGILLHWYSDIYWAVLHSHLNVATKFCGNRSRSCRKIELSNRARTSSSVLMGNPPASTLQGATIKWLGISG